MKKDMQALGLVKASRVRVVQVSRSEPVERVERRVMRVTAYTKNDAGMDGRGITNNGEHVQQGRTIAAPDNIPYDTQIYIPSLGKTFTVVDRGEAIYGNRLDLYFDSRKDALAFGVKWLEVWIKK